MILFYRRDVFHSDSHFTNRNDGFYLSQWWTLLIELKVSIISIAFLSIDRCTHRNFHIDRTIKKHRLIDVTYRSIDTYEAPYGKKLILFYRHDVFHSDSHFTNRNDGFYLSQWWTLLIELKVSIISIAFLSIDRCTHRNFHIDRTIKKHRLIDVMYRSIDTKGPSIDTKGPSIDTKGPSIDAKGPSIDRYEGMERRLGQNYGTPFRSKFVVSI